MAYTRYGLYADPSFQLGMALGDAYGTMWANNAKKRQTKKLDDYIESAGMNEVTNKPVQPIDGNIDNAIDAVENLSPTEQVLRRYENFNVDTVKDWANKNGINQEVLDARLPALQKEIATNVGGVLIPQITDKVYSNDINTIIDGIKQADILAKYDPVSAERLRRIGENSRISARDFQNKLTLGSLRPTNQRTYYKVSDDAMSKYGEELKGLEDMQQFFTEGQGYTLQQKNRMQWLRNMIAYGERERSEALGLGNLQQVTPTNPQEPTKNTEGNKDDNKAIDNMTTKAINDYGSDLQLVYGEMARLPHETRTFDLFKERANGVVATMKADGMTDEGINNYLRKVFDELDEDAHPAKFRNPDGGKKFAQAVAQGKPVYDIAHKY